MPLLMIRLPSQLLGLISSPGFVWSNIRRRPELRFDLALITRSVSAVSNQLALRSTCMSTPISTSGVRSCGSKGREHFEQIIHVIDHHVDGSRSRLSLCSGFE